MAIRRAIYDGGEVTPMRPRWSLTSLVQRFLAGWRRELTDHGIYVLNLYVAFYPALEDDRSEGHSGHPERLIPDQPLNPVEQRLWTQLTDVVQTKDETDSAR
jgi:hypothetical protein